jgi:signal transduction histidine kinase
VPRVGTAAWATGVLAVALAAAIVALDALGADALEAVAMLPDVLGFVCVGCLLLARRPGNPMGPLLCMSAAATAASTLEMVYARYTVIHPHGSLPFETAALWVDTWAWVPALCLGGFILPLVFPDGRLLSRRWRPALWAALAFVPLCATGNAFSRQHMGSYLGDLPNPYALSALEPLFATFLVLALVCAAVAVSAAAASVVVRWRRADQVVRQQLKWYLAVLPLTVAGLVVSVFSVGPASEAIPADIALSALSGLLTPAAIGVAVLRYRLYEIDVLLNRAVVYGSLTAVVVAVYLAVVGVAGVLFAGNRGLLAQAVAAVLAAAALWPLRDRVQRRVSRLFYGERRAPYTVLCRLGRSVQEADTDTALNSVVRAVAESLRLDYVAVELRQGEDWRPAAGYGGGAGRSFPTVFPLISQRETVGRLLAARAPGQRLAADEELLLADLARQAGPVIHAVALRRALDASRAGLVAAREEERRRVRRDLHDGLGPTLAGLTLGLDTALAKCAGQPEVRELLGRLKAETQHAVADVRRIVYGLRPPTLDELGLAGSLREHVARLSGQAPALTVSLEIPDDGLADLPAAVEVACYRLVTEALTNVARHACATACTVRVRRDHAVHLDVRDDGVGLPDGWRAGVGITSMRERVAEIGGDLVIEPCLPRGTRIAARLPAGAAA